MSKGIRREMQEFQASWTSSANWRVWDIRSPPFDSFSWFGKKVWEMILPWYLKSLTKIYVTWTPLNGLFIRTGNITCMEMMKGFDIMTDIIIVSVYWNCIHIDNVWVIHIYITIFKVIISPQVYALNLLEEMDKGIELVIKGRTNMAK